MCYDVQVGHERLIKDGIHSGAPCEQINKLIDDYNEKFNPAFPLPNVYHHVSAFTHPEIGVIHKQGDELVTCHRRCCARKRRHFNLTQESQCA